MSRKNSGAGLGVGSSSILMMFIVLALTTFAILSLISANAELRLAQQSAAAIREYYEADCAAEETLAQIDGILLQQRQTAPEQLAYLDALAQAVARDLPDVQIQHAPGENPLLQYRVPLDENRQLAVAVRALPITSQQRYAIEQWTVVTVGDWQPESEGFQLWDGEAGGEFVLADGLPF